jgi:hypothetical protein
MSNTKLPLGFNKNKVACRGIFIVSIWFYCKYQMGSGVIGYLYVYKLLFIFINDLSVLSTCQRVAAARAIQVARAAPKPNRASPYGVVFDAPRHPGHNSNALVPRQPTKELRLGGVFPPSPLSSLKIMLPNVKTQKGLTWLPDPSAWLVRPASVWPDCFYIFFLIFSFLKNYALFVYIFSNKFFVCFN